MLAGGLEWRHSGSATALSAMGDDESTAAARALPCWSELGEVTLVATTDESLSADL